MNGGRSEKGMRAMDNASRPRRPTTAHSWMVEWLLLFNVFFFSSLLFLSLYRSVNRMETLGEWMRNDNGKNYPSYFVHLQLTSRALNPQPASRTINPARHGILELISIVSVRFSLSLLALFHAAFVCEAFHILFFRSIVAPRCPAYLILVSVYIDHYSYNWHIQLESFGIFPFWSHLFHWIYLLWSRESMKSFSTVSICWFNMSRTSPLPNEIKTSSSQRIYRQTVEHLPDLLIIGKLPRSLRRHIRVAQIQISPNKLVTKAGNINFPGRRPYMIDSAFVSGFINFEDRITEIG